MTWARRLRANNALVEYEGDHKVVLGRNKILILTNTTELSRLGRGLRLMQDLCLAAGTLPFSKNQLALYQRPHDVRHWLRTLLFGFLLRAEQQRHPSPASPAP